MLKKLLLSTLIILGIIASTQAQSFDFDCAEEGVTLFTDGDSSANLVAGTFVVNGDVWEQGNSDEDFRVFVPQVEWLDHDIHVYRSEDGVWHIQGNTGIPNVRISYAENPAESEFTDFASLIDGIEVYRPLSHRGVTFSEYRTTNRIGAGLIVDGVEFVLNEGTLTAPHGWSDLPVVRFNKFGEGVVASLVNKFEVKTLKSNGGLGLQINSLDYYTAYSDAVDKLLSYSKAFPNVHYSGNSQLNLSDRLLVVDGFTFIPTSSTTFKSPAGYSGLEIHVSIENRRFVVFQPGGVRISTPNFNIAVEKIKEFRN